MKVKPYLVPTPEHQCPQCQFDMVLVTEEKQQDDVEILEGHCRQCRCTRVLYCQPV